jgi:hypothetical protein
MAASLLEMAFAVVDRTHLAAMYNTDKYLIRAAWLYAQCARYEKALACIGRTRLQTESDARVYCAVLCHLALGNAAAARAAASEFLCSGECRQWAQSVVAGQPADAAVPAACALLAERVLRPAQNK